MASVFCMSYVSTISLDLSMLFGIQLFLTMGYYYLKFNMQKQH